MALDSVQQLAQTTNGSVQVATKVTNSITGDNQLTFIIRNGGATDLANFPLIVGAWRADADKTLAAKPDVTFEGGADGFSSYDEMQRYFDFVQSQIAGITMETDNVANYINALQIRQKFPHGNEKVVSKTLNNYRNQVGTGYGETLEIPARDLVVLIWPGLEMTLKTLKANSYISFTFNMQGVSKSADLLPIEANTL